MVCSYTIFSPRHVRHDANDVRCRVPKCVEVKFGDVPSRKLRWQWKINHLKMYLLLNGDFPLPSVSFLGCIPSAVFFSNRTKSNGKNPALFAREKHLKS